MQESQETIRIFIVDDHQMMIDGIKALLKQEPRFLVTGTASRAEEALLALSEMPVNVLITDINMPGLSGAELTRRAKEQQPSLYVLALSMHDDRNTINEMLDAGINGYILKNTGTAELIGAINKIVNGGVFFSNDVAAEMMKALTEGRQAAAQAGTQPISLTPREKEIVELIAKEYSNAEIGKALFISERTVETHRKNIFRKTGTKTVAGLIKYAIGQKII